jgi:hypothetical protein
VAERRTRQAHFLATHCYRRLLLNNGLLAICLNDESLSRFWAQHDPPLPRLVLRGFGVSLAGTWRPRAAERKNVRPTWPKFERSRQSSGSGCVTSPHFSKSIACYSRP